MPPCIFCKIASKEVPAPLIYEDEFVVAFPDIKPVVPGHTLVIPKGHYRWFYDTPEEVSNAWFTAAKNIAKQIKEERGADYVQLSIVGKDVPHGHIHLMPRKFAEKHSGL